MADEVTLHEYPSQEWLEAVGKAIGEDATTVKGLIVNWVTLGKNAKEIQQRLTILAQQNGKRLFFSNPAQLS